MVKGGKQSTSKQPQKTVLLSIGLTNPTSTIVHFILAHHSPQSLRKVFRQSEDSSQSPRRLFAKSSKTLHKVFGDSLKTLQRLFRDSLKTLRRLFRDSSETL
ncbi:hypothetical protein FA15DRAFT_711754 [Coprinopsis marcescibilis]|uniref:Uncharacterized protein n=1 Tax=Coprinopsis marcescibilis TaxID=230819 RepID=A0A5C3K8W0_COPMA|nr:hypothetical protein FA15DRAFT_711754 [Coprinopsis marcescibilis]